MPSNWNRTMERLASSNLTGREARVVAFIARKTLGFRKSADLLATSQIAKGTGISRGNVSEILKTLIDDKIVTSVGGKQGRAAMLSLNLDAAWNVSGRADRST